MYDLAGKNVLIVGVTGGIGAALATAAARRGAAVYGLGRARGVPAGSLVAYASFSVVDEATLAVAAQNFPAFDVIFCATGFLHDDKIQPEKKLGQLTADAFEKNMQVNALLPLMVAKHFLPRIDKTRPTYFAALSARVGSISDNQLGGWLSYRMSKAALNMGLKTLSIETARTHPELCVLGLHPGTVDTGLSAPFQGFVPPEKLFTPVQSAAYLWDVLTARTPADSGQCFAWDGQKISA